MNDKYSEYGHRCHTEKWSVRQNGENTELFGDCDERARSIFGWVIARPSARRYLLDVVIVGNLLSSLARVWKLVKWKKSHAMVWVRKNPEVFFFLQTLEVRRFHENLNICESLMPLREKKGEYREFKESNDCPRASQSLAFGTWGRSIYRRE